MTQDPTEETVCRPPIAFGLALSTLLCVGLAFAAVTAPAPSAMVDIRFCNGTARPLGQVESGLTAFGDIASGACSPYRRLDRGYSQISFAAVIDGARVEHHLEDHVGSRQLVRGRYSFLILDSETGLNAELREIELTPPA